VAKAELAKAKAAGIPVIGVVGSDLNSGFVGIIQSPTTQGFKMGQVTAALALAEAGGKTSIAVGTDPDLPILKPTLAGMEDIVQKDGQGSAIQSFSLSIALPPEENVAATVSFLQRHPDVKVLLYTASQLATGAFEQLQAAGVLDRVTPRCNKPMPALLLVKTRSSTTSGKKRFRMLGFCKRKRASAQRRPTLRQRTLALKRRTLRSPTPAARWREPKPMSRELNWSDAVRKH
jgi:ribosomal protein L35